MTMFQVASDAQRFVQGVQAISEGTVEAAVIAAAAEIATSELCYRQNPAVRREAVKLLESKFKDYYK